MILFFAFLYFHPIKEVLTCEEDLQCSIVREYPLKVHYTSKFPIDSNSKLVGKMFYSPVNLENTNGNYFVRFFIQKDKLKYKNPFIFSTRIFKDKETAEKYVNSTMEKYNNYIITREKPFCLYSEANELCSIAGLMLITIILIRVFVV